MEQGENICRIAIKDISEYMKENNIQIMDGNHDVWVVSASRVYCAEQRKLNKELGISGINKTKEVKLKRNK